MKIEIKIRLSCGKMRNEFSDFIEEELEYEKIYEFTAQ